jgi:S1-C subfamily serine protease
MTETPENQSETTATPPTEENNNISPEITTPQTEMPPTSEQTPLSTQTAVNTETKYCKQCGEFFENMYCKHCGTFNGPEQAVFEPMDNSSGVPPPVSPSHSMSRSRRQKSRNTKTVIVALLAICVLAGSFIGYAVTYSMFNDRFTDLQNQLSSTQQSFNGLNDRINSLQSQLQISQLNEQKNSVEVDLKSNDNTVMDLSELYQTVRKSVVVIQCLVPQYNWFGFQVSYSTQQGSGFVITANGQQVIVTNNHVINSGSNITVTFADSSSYTATVLGSDAYADLAILKVDNMPNGVPSLTLVSSSTLNVGDAVVAVGSPYGLTGTLTTGIISSLGRTITETINNRAITIPDIIQATAEINPGNSGGPLINYKGQVIGITTATVSNSQGLGFAISADTIMREIDSLINTGKYTQHPTISATGRDMTLQLAQTMNIDITYGWLVDTTTENSGLKSGDIIIKAGTTTITNIDDLLTYLERNTLPGQNVEFTIIRNGQQQTTIVHINALNN